MSTFLSLFTKKKQTHNIQHPSRASFTSLIGDDPFVDWTLIVLVVCVVSAILIAIGGYVYIGTQDKLNNTGTIMPASTAASRFDVKKLSSVIDIFDARAKERVMLQKSYQGPKDPLLP